MTSFVLMSWQIFSILDLPPRSRPRSRLPTIIASLPAASQRKNGLFKKAYELGVLCSVDVAVIIFGV